MKIKQIKMQSICKRYSSLTDNEKEIKNLSFFKIRVKSK